MVGFVLCATILVITTVEKFLEFDSPQYRHTQPLVWQHGSGRCSLVIGATASHILGMHPADGRVVQGASEIDESGTSTIPGSVRIVDDSRAAGAAAAGTATASA